MSLGALGCFGDGVASQVFLVVVDYHCLLADWEKLGGCFVPDSTLWDCRCFVAALAGDSDVASLSVAVGVDGSCSNFCHPYLKPHYIYSIIAAKTRAIISVLSV